MAKVKIQGNASGTGVLTVTAPNTSTDRTITLPDATGTLFTDAGGTMTGALTVSSDLNVNGEMNLTNSSGINYIDFGGSSLKFRNDNSTPAYEDMLILTKDGSVEATHNGSKKFETTATGIAVTGGVAIGGTDAAHTLDDYEEGNWSSVLRLGGDGGADNVNSTSYAKYTKIGNLVYINVSISMLNTISGSGHLVITGLPFVPVNSAQLSCRFNDNMNSSDVVAQATGSSAIHFYKQSTSTGGALNNYTNSDINSTASGKHVNVSGTYRTS